MKIAMLLDNSFTNHNRVLKEAKSLADHGYKVTVICKNEPDLSLPAEELVKGFTIKRLYKYHLGTSVLVDYYLQAHFDLYNNLDEQFDLYHCHDPATWPIGYILARRDQAKLIYDSHEYFPDYICKEWHSNSFKYEFAKILVQARGQYISYADGVIVVSKKIANILMKEFDLKEKPTVLYNTRPILDYRFNKNKLREKYSIPDNLKILLFQGIVEPTRGVDIAIKAMKYVQDSIFVIAGGDRAGYIDQLKKLAVEYGVADKVIFTGFIPSELLLEYSFCTDIMVYFGRPVVKNMEYTIPNKFFDSIIAEKPIIVGDLWSLRDIVEKYRIGEVVDIHNIDVKKIATIINKLIHNTESCNLYAANAQKIKNQFSWEKQEEKLLELYQRVISENKKDK